MQSKPLETAVVRPAGQVFSGARKLRIDIQVLRAVAVLAVILFHAGLPLEGGYLGVDVFFVVSGFVITTVLIREHSETGRISIGAFYRRRVRRLIPALALMIGVVATLSIVIYPTFGTYWPAFITGIFGLLFAANLAVDRLSWDYFAPLSEWNPFLHLWSLGVEEQFYIVFPLFLLAIVSVFEKRKGRALILLVGVILLSFLLTWFGASDAKIYLPFGQSFIGFYSPLTRAWEFLAGVLAAFLPSRSLHGSASRVLVWMMGVALGVSLVYFEADVEDRAFSLLVPVLATAGILWLGKKRVLPRPTGARRMVRLLERIGDASYSLYLWHWPFMVLASYVYPASHWVKLFSLMVSVPLAVLSYVAIENKVRNGGRVFGLGPLAFSTFLSGIALSLLVLAALIVTQLTGPFVERKASDKDVFSSGMGEAISLGTTSCAHYEQCVQTVGPESQGIAILGASHGADLFLGIAEAFPNHSVSYISRSSDAYLTPTSQLHKQILSDTSIGTVVIAHAFNQPRAELNWNEIGLAVENFVEAGKIVLINDDVPNLGFDPTRCAFGIPIAPEFKSCAVSSVPSDQRRSVYLPEILDLAEESNSVAIIRSYEVFCQAGQCLAGNQDELWFRDSDHLTAEGSRKIGRSLPSKILELVS